MRTHGLGAQVDWVVPVADLVVSSVTPSGFHPGTLVDVSGRNGVGTRPTHPPSWPQSGLKPSEYTRTSLAKA